MALQNIFFRIFMILWGFPSIVSLTKSTDVESVSIKDILNVNVWSQNTMRRHDVLQLTTAIHRIKTSVSDRPGLYDLIDNDDLGESTGVKTLDFMNGHNISLSKCVNDTERLVKGFLGKNVWVIPFLDAAGKPGPSLAHGWLYFVGNPHQCKSAKAPSHLLPSGERAGEFHGAYFQVAFELSSITVPIRVGLCLPDTCSQDQVAYLGKKIIQAANVSISIKYVRELTNATEMTSATILAIIFSSIIGFMMIVSTLYDIIVVQLPLWKEGVQSKRRDGLLDLKDETVSLEETRTLLEHDKPSQRKQNVLCFRFVPHQADHGNNYVHKILIAFSVYSNGKKLLDVSQATNSVQSIHGIRFLSIAWVVLGHIYGYGLPYSLNSADAANKYLNSWTFDIIANGFVSVDTFFALSGLLTCYITIGQILRKGLRLNWAMFYFHRFWRLTPPYMLVILLHLGFQQYLIKGPMRSATVPIDKEQCEKYWWTNLLYINNIVEKRNMCLEHTWFLSNDMQFFILSPLMMLPFYFHRLAGLCTCFVFLLATWITTGVVSSSKELPTTTITLRHLDDNTRKAWWTDYYSTPWCRVGPFVIGVIAGYILAVHKGKQFYVKRWVLALGWIVSTASALAVLFGLRGDISGDDSSSSGVAALYNSMSHSVWGGCVCWVIIVCTAGYGGPINSFLSWSPFVVLGRLSYMVYLIHFPILYIFYENLDMPFYSNHTTVVVYFLGMLMFTNLVAFVLVLALESPMIQLEKSILKKEE